jgi:hypothetical protein
LSVADPTSAASSTADPISAATFGPGEATPARRVVRRTGRADGALDAALEAAGVTVTDAPDATLVHRFDDVRVLDQLTPALTAWAAEARTTTGADGDVIAIVDADGFDSDEVAPAMLAHGIVAGTRALAMERERPGTRANLVVVGADVDAAEVADTITWLLRATSTTAQVVTLGAARHGRQPA